MKLKKLLFFTIFSILFSLTVGHRTAFASKTCSISGEVDNLSVNGAMNLAVTYNNSWETNDKYSNKVDWYEVDPVTNQKRIIGSQTSYEDECNPATSALGIFSDINNDTGGSSNTCSSYHSQIPDTTATWTANKNGTTIIEAHPWIYYRGGSCDSCQSKSDDSHAVCRTNVITVGILDTTPPTTTPTFYSYQFSDTSLHTWYELGITVVLECHDNSGGSGCSTIQYCQDTNNSCTPSTNIANFGSFNVNTEGKSYVRYKSTDIAGNVEKTKSSTIQIDLHAPTTTATVNGNNTSGPTVTLSCLDTISGINTVSGCDSNYPKYCIDTANICTPATKYSAAIAVIGIGDHYVRYQSKDVAGLTEAVKSTKVTVTEIPPPPPPPPPIQATVSGKLYNKSDTTQPVGIGQKVLTCGADPSRDPIVAADGTFSFGLQQGDLFCIKGPTVTGYELQPGAAVNETGNPQAVDYELQVAGIDCTQDTQNPACQATNPDGSKSTVLDKGIDSDYNLAYSQSATLPPSGPILQKVEISEDQLFPASSTTVLNPQFPLNSNNLIYTIFQFADSTPGIKSVWVRYTSDQGSTQVIGPISIELVKDDNGSGLTYPHINTLACSRDSTTNNVNFTINGDYFGQTVGTLTSGSTPLTVVGNWTQTLVSATYNNAPADQSSFNVTLTRFDGRLTNSTCNLSSAQVSIGADYFCPAIPNHSESNVNLTLYDASASSTISAKLLKTQVTIDPLGIIQGLNYNFLEGKTYTLSIKTAVSLLKFGTFVAKTLPGTTTVLNITLPVGDIYPVSGDGVINTFDQSSLETEWGTPPPPPNGDFNLDGIINSFDWACMKYNFGETNDSVPSFPITQ